MNFINKMTKDSGEHKTNNIINIIKGSAISIFFSIVALIIFSIILTITQLTELSIKPVVIGITAILIVGIL